jgi:hypothetical protein
MRMQVVLEVLRPGRKEPFLVTIARQSPQTLAPSDDDIPATITPADSRDFVSAGDRCVPCVQGYNIHLLAGSRTSILLVKGFTHLYTPCEGFTHLYIPALSLLKVVCAYMPAFTCVCVRSLVFFLCKAKARSVVKLCRDRDHTTSRVRCIHGATRTTCITCITAHHVHHRTYPCIMMHTKACLFRGL